MMRHGCAQAILTFLVILISCPMESDCEEDSYNSILQDSPYYLSSDLTHSKRYRDIHDDTFVGLMGRRSAGVNDLPSRRSKIRDMDDVFVGLLGRRSSGSAIPQPWREDVYPQPSGGILIKKGRLRFVPGV
uniref:Tachykinin precursor 3b n=1 Tax=Hucho hucho TaxID=62062 RepID=A0A4W5R5C9_9TELE